jgi:glycosyltransferase involved in cell wall biosynthesis
VGDKTMKLLFFIFSLAGGGAERVTVSLANHWAAKGWKISIVTDASATDDAYVLEPSITRISLGLARGSRNIGDALLQNYRRVMALRRTLLNTRPDVAVAMMDTACVTLALAARGLTNILPVGSIRVYPPAHTTKSIWKGIQSLAYGQFPAVVTQACATAAWLAANTKAGRIKVIPNPIQWPHPNGTPRIEPDAICHPERKLLLAAGRLVAQKGFDLLINAFADLSKQHEDWDLVILGEGVQRQRLEAMIAARGLMHRVFLPGWAGNLSDWYRRSQLYVMSSRYEGFGNTLAEAMAHGLPAVSFDCDAGPGDIIRNGVDGFLVPGQDTPALAAALSRLMGEAELRQQFGVAAMEIRDRYSMPRIIQMWENLFEELMASRSSKATAA